MSPSAFAQTPDGVTPANEGVCDGLQGATPGLYGLCVAFCEAQDITTILAPITEEELVTLESAMPSGSILSAYNRKRDKADNGIDPSMPCVVIEEPCPCWTAAELSAATPPNSNFDANFGNACFESPPQITLIENIDVQNNGGALFQIAVFSNVCTLFNGNGFLGLPPSRLLGTNPEENEACRQSIRDYANSGSNRIDGERWDCFN